MTKIAQPRCHAGPEALRLRGDVAHRAREPAQRGQALRQTVGVAVQWQHSGQRSQGQLVASQRAFEGVLLEPGNQVRAAHHDARLRATQQLVAAEGHKVSPGGQGLGGCGFMRQTVGRQVIDRATAQVDDKGQPAFLAQRGQRVFIGALSETFDAVIAGVHLQHQRCFGVDGLGNIGHACAVGGAHFTQAATGGGHDVGQAKGAADLHQFTARDDHFAALGQRGQHQHQGGGVVVDDGGRWCAGQALQPGFDVVVAVTAPTCGQVKFKVAGTAGNVVDGAQRLGRQRRAAQIGVQHRAGEVEDAAQAGPQQ